MGGRVMRAQRCRGRGDYWTRQRAVECVIISAVRRPALSSRPPPLGSLPRARVPSDVEPRDERGVCHAARRRAGAKGAGVLSCSRTLRRQPAPRGPCVLTHPPPPAPAQARRTWLALFSDMPLPTIQSRYKPHPQPHSSPHPHPAPAASSTAEPSPSPAA